MPIKYTDDPDTSKINFIFFKDGICIYEFYNKPEKQYIEECAREKKAISSQFTGTYKVIGDTIKMQIINDARGMMPTWAGWEKQFLIGPGNVLKYISSKPLHSNKKTDIETFNRAEKNRIYFAAMFTPVDSMPSSYIWLMEKKWFWCEDAWEKRKSK